MTTIRCKALDRGFATRQILVVGVAVGLLCLLPAAGHAQPTCNPAVQLGLTGENFGVVGDTYAVDLVFGVGIIGNGTQATVNAIRYNLDCEGGDESDIACDSATLKISYQGNLTVNAGCPEQNWTATHSAGDTAPNRVTFTPDGGAFLIAESTSPCTLTFDVQIEELDDAGDSTPDQIESNGGYDGNLDDIVCDNGLSPSATGLAAIQTCPVCDDGLFCNGEETCNQETGECTNPDDVVCDDGVFCNGLEICTEEGEGGCVPGTPPTCDDEATCTTDVCDTGIDDCVNSPNNAACDDQDVCTDNICDPEAATADAVTGCTFPTASPLPAECTGDFTCRTCGFWGNHPAIVQQLLDDAEPPIAVCGGPDMNTTEAGEATSANEAICTKGGGIQQLARQLTCLALNCQFSSGPPLDMAGLVPVANICTGQTSGGQDLGDLFAECDLACETDSALVGSCIDRVDCVNNGGTPVQVNGDWTCAAGECSIDGALCGFDEGDCAVDECVNGFCTLTLNGAVACVTDADCTTTQFCDLFEAENCHERDLCPEGENTYCFEPPGPAKPGECKASRKSKCNYADLDCND